MTRQEIEDSYQYLVGKEVVLSNGGFTRTILVEKVSYWDEVLIVQYRVIPFRKIHKESFTPWLFEQIAVVK